MFVLTVLWWNNLDAAYIEGIDTTGDVNGLLTWGMDSLFYVNHYEHVVGHVIGDYIFDTFSALGFFSYKFDEVQIAPITPQRFRNIPTGPHYHCFITKNPKDSTYAKFQIQEKLPDGRYVYRYGKNTVPHDRMLVRSDYDRSVRYKPNNLYNLPGEFSAVTVVCTTSWEPPLPSDNHLLGYIFYSSKTTTIDTTAPINIDQWDSTGYFADTKFNNPGMLYKRGHYFNIVAVYSEGRSAFLNGWSKAYFLTNVNTPSLKPLPSKNNPVISHRISGRSLFMTLASGFSAFSLVAPNGSIVARFSGSTGRTFSWSPPGPFPPGLYLLRAEFPDRSAVTQPFVVAR